MSENFVGEQSGIVSRGIDGVDDLRDWRGQGWAVNAGGINHSRLIKLLRWIATHLSVGAGVRDDNNAAEDGRPGREVRLIDGELATNGIFIDGRGEQIKNQPIFGWRHGARGEIVRTAAPVLPG